MQRPPETREEAAAQLFNRNPTARTVQTCKAFADDVGTWRGSGMDIRWISR
jgi:hypothetical protein